ncbi:MAG: hypothetical protein AABX65_03675, partial [Nanoarchaeota archaeon]
LWSIAVILFAITFYFFYYRRCISKNLILLNAGFIIAGVPFASLQKYNVFFWIIGGIFVLMAVVGFVKSHNRKL